MRIVWVADNRTWDSAVVPETWRLGGENVYWPQLWYTISFYLATHSDLD